MSSSTMYVQCFLQFLGTTTYTTVWIPYKIAKVNNVLINDEGEEVIIRKVYKSIKVKHSDVLNMQVAYKYQRKASDI